MRSATSGAFHDEIAGFVYFGNEMAEATERARPEYDSIVSEWTAAG